MDSLFDSDFFARVAAFQAYQRAQRGLMNSQSSSGTINLRGNGVESTVRANGEVPMAAATPPTGMDPSVLLERQINAEVDRAFLPYPETAARRAVNTDGSEPTPGVSSATSTAPSPSAARNESASAGTPLRATQQVRRLRAGAQAIRRQPSSIANQFSFGAQRSSARTSGLSPRTWTLRAVFLGHAEEKRRPTPQRLSDLTSRGLGEATLNSNTTGTLCDLHDAVKTAFVRQVVPSLTIALPVEASSVNFSLSYIRGSGSYSLLPFRDAYRMEDVRALRPHTIYARPSVTLLALSACFDDDDETLQDSETSFQGTTTSFDENTYEQQPSDRQDAIVDGSPSGANGHPAIHEELGVNHNSPVCGPDNVSNGLHQLIAELRRDTQPQQIWIPQPPEIVPSELLRFVSEVNPLLKTEMKIRGGEGYDLGGITRAFIGKLMLCLSNSPLDPELPQVHLLEGFSTRLMISEHSSLLQGNILDAFTNFIVFSIVNTGIGFVGLSKFLVDYMCSKSGIIPPIEMDDVTDTGVKDVCLKVVITLLVASAPAQQVPYGLVPPAPYNSYEGPFAPEFYGPEQFRYRRAPATFMKEPAAAMMMNPLLSTQDYYPSQQQQQLQQSQPAYPNSLLTLDEISRTPLFREYLTLPLFRQWLPSYSFQQFLESPLFQHYWTSPVFQQFFREPALFYKYVYPAFSTYHEQFPQAQPQQQQFSYAEPRQQMPLPMIQQQQQQQQFSYPEPRQQMPLPMIQPQQQQQFSYYEPRQQTPPPMIQQQQQPFAPEIDSYLPRNFDYFPQDNNVDYFPRNSPAPFYQNEVASYQPTYWNKPAAATPVVYLLRPEGRYNPTTQWYNNNPSQNTVVTRRAEIPFRILKVPAPRPQQEQLDEQVLVEKILKALFMSEIEAEMASEEMGGKESETSMEMAVPMEEEKPAGDDEEFKFVPLEENTEIAPKEVTPKKEMEPSSVAPEVSEKVPTTEETPVILEATTENRETIITPSETVDLVKLLTANKRFARFDKKPTKLEKKELIGAEEKAINNYYKYEPVQTPEEVVLDVQKRSEDAPEPAANYKTTDTDGLHSVPLSQDQSSWSNFREATAGMVQNFKGNDDDQTYSSA